MFPAFFFLLSSLFSLIIYFSVANYCRQHTYCINIYTCKQKGEQTAANTQGGVYGGAAIYAFMSLGSVYLFRRHVAKEQYGLMQEMETRDNFGVVSIYTDDNL